MLFVFHCLRIYRKIPCFSRSTLTYIKYSKQAELARKQLNLQQRVCRPVNKSHIIKSSNMGTVRQKVLLNPALQDVQTINTTDDRLVDDNQKEAEWKNVELDTSKLKNHCLMLSKVRLTSLVVVTTMGGYALAPGPFDLYTLVACSMGTGLVSATANAINQFFEVPFDAQMSRTKNRVLVRGHLTPAHAVMFAAVSGVTGLTLLYSEVNSLTAILGAANLVLYTAIYTPMKRISILNTWIGSIVGAIPPLMGWAACAGSILSPGAWIMSGILYAWQFPHFNALSWNLRPDYSRAGYRMMAVTDPDLCRKTSLRYTVILTGLCYLAPVFDVTDWWFSAASTPLNGYFLYLAWKFYKESDSGNSRKLFKFSLIHLPLLMILMFASKKYWFVEKEKTDSIRPAAVEQKKIFSSPVGLWKSAESST